ncbi:retrovirus-related pol polyprotein from transposon TNT 1-94 [Tanacetum coccineum]
MFDEFFNPPPSVVSPVPVAAARRPADPTGSPVSTSLKQDAPSASTSLTQEQEHSPIISQGVEESPKTPHFYDDPLHETLHEDSTSQGSSSNVRPSHTPFKLLVEPKYFKEALLESSWIKAMQEEIHEFERLQVWELVPCSDLVKLIKLKWIFKVKKDECGEYDNLADGCQNGFLEWRAREVVYVTQPEGFVDQDKLNHVYRLKKALYGLKQAPRAWYDMLSSFLLSQEFSKGAVDPTLFTRKAGRDILLVQIYVDDIIFTSTKAVMCDEFAKIMSSKFKMSMMSKMSFFLGLQISQSPRCIFINQSNYALEIIKKYVKRIFRYLKRTIDMGLWYSKDSFITLTAYVDADHAGYHFIKEQVENGVVELYFIKIEYQLADIFTKALPRERFNFLIEKLGMKSMSPETLKNLSEEEEE